MKQPRPIYHFTKSQERSYHYGSKIDQPEVEWKSEWRIEQEKRRAEALASRQIKVKSA